MRVKSESERFHTLIDPFGPIEWLDNETLVGRMREVSSKLIAVRFVGESELAKPAPDNFYFKDNIPIGHHLKEELVSPDGKKVAVRMGDDAFAMVAVYDIE